jgi:3-hydroxyacyl-[acyl-carrier-protein] dehydratase
MLKDSFYTILNFDSAAEGVIRASFQLHTEHAIFQGHFPGLPVVPGVCMLHMVKECLQQATGLRFRLQLANNIKFLSVLDPLVHGTVQAVINFEGSEDGILVSDAVLSSDTAKFLKAQKVRYILQP